MTKKGDRIEVRSGGPEDYENVITALQSEGAYRESSDNPDTYDRTLERDSDAMLVAIGHGKVRRNRFLGVVFTKYDPEDHYQKANIYAGAIIPGYKRRANVRDALVGEARKRLLSKLVQRAEQLIDEQIEEEKEDLEKQGTDPEEKRQELKNKINWQDLESNIVIRFYS